MELLDIIDAERLQQLQDWFADATGVAVSMIDKNGKHITRVSNFLDFCIKYTRGSKVGLERCQKCDREGVGTYFCHAGLMDFAADVVVNGEKLATILGGQVLPAPPDFDKFRQVAVEIGVDPDEYIEALKKVPVKTEKSIRAAADLMGEMINMLVNLEYFRKVNADRLNTLQEEVVRSTDLIQSINDYTSRLKTIANRQKILSLNASIEAARSGEAGVGFAVVAKSMQDLSSQSAVIYNDIETSVAEITQSISLLSSLFHQENEEQ